VGEEWGQGGAGQVEKEEGKGEGEGGEEGGKGGGSGD